MLNGSSLDNLVRSSLTDPVAAEAPSASVRDSLLAEAARVRTRSSVGPAIPPLVNSLRESGNQANGLTASRPFLSGHDVAEKWLMMIVPVYAVR